MTILEVLNDPVKLKTNYETIIALPQFTRHPDVSKIKFINKLPTTHSFGYSKVIKVAGVDYPVYPAKKILFENKSFQSDNLRDASALPTDPPMPKRTMTKARDFGLDHFVFAYLGVHEYYYTQAIGTNTPAFGAYFSTDLDHSTTYINIVLTLPERIIDMMCDEGEKTIVKIPLDNKVRDEIEPPEDNRPTFFIGNMDKPKQYGLPRNEPLLPGMKMTLKSFPLYIENIADGDVLSWTLHADNAEPQTGTVEFGQIAII